MKIKQLLVAITLIVLAISFNSCKKDKDAIDEFETTFELSGDQAIADNLTEDAGDVLNEVALDKGLMGTNGPVGPSGTMGILTCATVTVTPLTGFPKTIVIDFGVQGCASNGIFRRGKINILLTDSLRKSGSVATMTFDNYFVNGYKKEGIITWTNTSTPGSKSWNRTCTNGKITAPDGRWWKHDGTQAIVQTAGV
ncbi:MAG TPA: hypothetical protein VK498_12125, partial [Ferruginibacter sp.]|nr:hypothetical protein [Ferruginibacter sp.]